VGIMMLWAVISICTAFSGSFGGLVATRFCLGVVEAPYCESSASPPLEHASDPLPKTPALCTSFRRSTQEPKS
jgi:hypothetical protein